MQPEEITRRGLVALATTVKSPARPEDVTTMPARVHISVDGIALPGAKSIELRRIGDNLEPAFGPGPVTERYNPERFEMVAVFDIAPAEPPGNWCVAKAVARDDLRSVFADVLEVYGLTDAAEDLPGALIGALDAFLTGRFADRADNPPHYYS